MKKSVIWFLLLYLLMCGGSSFAESAITRIEQLNAPGITIGVNQGDIAELVVKNELPQATINYFDDKFMGYLAVAQGKIDAYAYDRRQMELSIENGQKGIHLLEENLKEPMKVAVGISPVSKIPDLPNKINQFIAELKADGTLDDMFYRWVVKADETMPDIPRAENPSVHLTVGTSGIVPPYSYYIGKELNGYDIELAYRFAAWLGADVEFKVYNYNAIYSAAKVGDIDCIMANLEYSEERAEEVIYSDILLEVEIGLAVRGDASPASASTPAEKITLDSLNGKRVGVQTGTTFDAIVHETLPDAVISYFNTYSDMAVALETDKIDAFLGDEPVIRLMASENKKLTALEEHMDDFEFGIALPKTESGKKLLAEINAWLASMKASGELEQLTKKWTDGPESEKTVPDYRSFSAPNGVLTLATEGNYAPMSYYRGNEVVGLEIDMIARFCEANGYGLAVVTMQFDGILPAILSGKADFAAAGFTITEERKESVYFSDPYYKGGTVMAILKSKASASAQQTAGAGITSMDELKNARIGVKTGTTEGKMVEDRFPEATVTYYNTTTDLAAALLKSKIDSFPLSVDALGPIMKENERITYLSEPLSSYDCGFSFGKTESGEKLCAQFNTFLQDIKADGTLEKIREKWTGSLEQDPVNYDALPSTNGKLRMATVASYPPFEYVSNGHYAGLDIELATRFCETYGYGLEIVDMSFDAVIASVQTGKCDFGGSGIEITEERAQNVYFSELYHNVQSVMAVVKVENPAAAPASGEVEVQSIWDSIVSSFNKTFIRENRWELFLSGVRTTLLITVVSILLGTTLGFLVFMLCRNGNIIANGVTRFFMWLVQGMPMVVLLMILYYIIFGSVAINGILVAVIGFTLTFGAAVFGLLKMGVGTIDQGQYEAAYALGYANRRTFFRIILPQAIPHVLPAYKGEIVGLIKATAIVGYIAVQDLTKMGDIVRSRTYEAFFPLIAVTVIYFVLEGLLGFLVSKIQIRMNPKKRKPEKILKGVKTND